MAPRVSQVRTRSLTQLRASLRAAQVAVRANPTKANKARRVKFEKAVLFASKRSKQRAGKV